MRRGIPFIGPKLYKGFPEELLVFRDKTWPLEYLDSHLARIKINNKKRANISHVR